ncbi:hypothetical protein [Algoriphagus antarcticus]|uniref:Uncharacterized protein n=1 Tax=Algoriphagus antarcticus TaxID=238540 RepID=A0A3E0E6X9_9BACT|nr:hypothetical protein [Algoriphagus antarcticus]REG92746.1 hypothetical protein C8N25_102149 [Algoriphagus antarcticus]
MKYYLTLSLLLFFFLQSCQEDNIPLNHLEFYWDQTGCADPWNSNSNNSNEEIQQAVENYLKEEGIRNAKVTSITNDGFQQVCFACFCTTGRRINVTVPTNQKGKMIALGFKESL